MTSEQIEEELINFNRTEYLEQLILDENVTSVNIHNDIFFHPTYSQIVRLLFNFMASQVVIKFKELFEKFEIFSSSQYASYKDYNYNFRLLWSGFSQ